jgi:hypothetical protein
MIRIIKLPLGAMIPEKYLWIQKILFPIQFFALHNTPIRYDYCKDTIIIDGVEYSRHVFYNSNIFKTAPCMLDYLIESYKSGGVFDEAEMRAVIEAATGQSIDEITAATGREG